MNILDYIKWRGDLTFDERKLNEVDSLIFSILSYENYDGILNENNTKTISQTADEFFQKYDEETLKKRVTMTNRSYELLKAAAHTRRFGNIKMMNYINEVEETQNLQFSAVTFVKEGHWKYIAFRGTDDTIVGWKEDFCMSYKNEVLSQRKAVEYLTKITSEQSIMMRFFDKGEYYVGGHSKGGNLAMYASAFANEKVLNKIRRIDNFDGPGFSKEIWGRSHIQKILPQIHTFIPTSSVFGRLFAHPENVSVIKSDATGLRQHDAFSWHTESDHLVYMPEVSPKSDKALSILNGLLEEYGEEDREKMVNSLFKVFENLQIKTLSDLTRIDAGKVLMAFKEIAMLDAHSKRVLVEVLKAIWDVTDIFPIH